jgi:hypothetical protein
MTGSISFGVGLRMVELRVISIPVKKQNASMNENTKNLIN